MKAAVLRGLNQRMEIEDISVSKPQGREVLVRMMAVGVCHSDLHVITGDSPHPLPAVLGHEAAGIVEQVGPEVHNVKPGDHVIVCLTSHCGHCEHCLGGHSRCRTLEHVLGCVLVHVRVLCPTSLCACVWCQVCGASAL